MRYGTKKRKELLEGLGEVIWYRRRQLKIGQKELAQKTDLSRNAISLIENGKTEPGAFSLLKIATELKLKIEDFAHLIQQASLPE
jgi:transcriptional regulator with XRE-family HTH domain